MVLENNVDNQTFGDAIEHMENTIKEPNRAFLSYKDYVLNDEKHKCKVKILLEIIILVISIKIYALFKISLNLYGLVLLHFLAVLLL